MKSYKESAENVLRRRDEYLEKAKRRRSIAMRSASAAVCVCAAVGVILVAPWKRNDSEVTPSGLRDTATFVNTDEDISTSREDGGKSIGNIVVSYTSSRKGDWNIVPPSVGEVYVSPDLIKARQVFQGQDVGFLVFIDIIDENERYLLEEEKEAEYARLEALGYKIADVFLDIPDDADFRRSRAFELTEAQIADFAASDKFGYLLRFTGGNEEELQGELGFVEMADGSVCAILRAEGTITAEQYHDRFNTDTGVPSEDFG